MSGQLIPSPELAPSVPNDATPEQCIQLWVAVMNACEAFLLAGLRREIGPDGNLQEAHREWYAQAMREHDEAIHRMVCAFNVRSENNDG